MEVDHHGEDRSDPEGGQWGSLVYGMMIITLCMCLGMEVYCHNPARARQVLKEFELKDIEKLAPFTFFFSTTLP